MADETDIASDREQLARDMAIKSLQDRVAHSIHVDVPARVCAGCEEKTRGKACPDYPTCFEDFERRVSAQKRAGGR